MKRESNQKISKAYELYCQGKNISEIAAELKASPEELMHWKKLCAGTPRDWAEGRRAMAWSPGLWLDKKIVQTMRALDKADESGQKALRDCLDDYISMKKKYESSIDRFGETKRVMEDFIGYLKDEFREHIPLLKDIIEAYLRHVGR